MKCREIKKKLAYYLEEALPQELEHHLVDCPKCNEYYQKLLADRKLLKALEVETPPADLRENILRRLKIMERDTEKKSFSNKMRAPWQVKPIYAFTALLLVVFVAFGLGYYVLPTNKAYEYANAPSSMFLNGGLSEDSIQYRSMKMAAEEVGMDFGASLERKIIYTGNLTIEVLSADEQQEYILNYLKDRNGFIAETRRTVGASEEVQIRMVLRIPVSSFDLTLLELAKLGKVTEQGIQGRDITEEYYDLETRLETKKKQEARYLEILNTAKTVEEVLKVERELERTRGEIESMEGTLRYYKDRTDLATITLILKEPTKITSGGFSFRSLLKEISEAFFKNIKGLLVFIGGFLPWLLVLGILVLLVVIFKRRR